jgi:FkbM family methyltransferase
MYRPRRWMKRGRIWFNRFRGYGVSTAGIRVPIDRTRLSRKMEKRLSRGDNQQAEFEAARAVIRPGDVVLELGAGLGVISAALRRHTGASRIVAFEPNPDLSDYIPRTHALNGVFDVELRRAVVLSDPKGSTIPFYRHPNLSSGSLSQRSTSFENAVEVAVVGLKEVLAEVTPNVLLVDIEGAEIELFEGAENLGSVGCIVLELHEGSYGHEGILRLFRASCRLGLAYDSQLSTGKFIVLRRAPAAEQHLHRFDGLPAEASKCRPSQLSPGLRR